MILDRYGNPVPIQSVRRALGFVSQPLPDDEREPVTGIVPPKSDRPWPEQDHEPAVGA